MSDLSDDEIKSIERSLGGPGNVLTSRSETCRMLAELQRRRAADLGTEDVEILRNLLAPHVDGRLYHVERDVIKRVLAANGVKL